MTRHKLLTAALEHYKVQYNPQNDPYRKPKIEKNTGKLMTHFSRAEQNTLNGSLIWHQLGVRLATVPYSFNILAFEQVANQWYEQQITTYCTENKIPMKGRITFAFNSSTGDHISPWMICHKMGHGLIEKEALRHTRSNIEHSLMEFFDGIDGYGPPWYQHGLTMFTFKSAREGTLLWTETVNECVAQYLMTGRVTLQNRYQVKANEPLHPGQLTPQLYKEFDQVLRDMERMIETDIKSALDSSIGGVVMDNY